MIFPPERVSQEANSDISTVAGMRSQVMEKPTSKEDQIRMLDLMAGKECEVITGVTIGKEPIFQADPHSLSKCRCSRLQARVYVMLDTVPFLR